MDPKTIEALHLLLETTSQNAIVGMWQFWIVLCVVPAISAWVGSYFKKRGENAAIQRDLEDLKGQLAATTKVTEEIKQQIGFEDWWSKESLIVRRQQLERIVVGIANADRAIHEWWRGVTTETQGFIPIPTASLDEIRAPIALYHPSLMPSFRRFESAWLAHTAPGAALSNRLRVLRPQTPDDSLDRIIADTRNTYDTLISNLAVARREIENSANALMQEMLSPSMTGNARG